MHTTKNTLPKEKACATEITRNNLSQIQKCEVYFSEFDIEDFGIEKNRLRTKTSK